MAKISKINLRQLFAKGMKPAQEAFYNLFDSFWHKDELIEMAAVKDLQNTLDNKLDVGVEEALISAVNEAVANSKAIVKGEATPSSFPTPWIPGNAALYEKWEVKTVGVYVNFKNSNGVPIEITADDLDKKFAFINVTNGISKKDLVQVPIFTAKQVYDKTDNVNSATMKANADRYDKALEVLNYFFNEVDYKKINVNNDSAKIPKIDGSFVENPGSHLQEILIPDGFNKLKFKGYVVQVNTPNLPLYAAIQAKKKDGSYQLLLQPETTDQQQSVKEIDVNIPANTQSIIVCWNNFGVSLNSIPEVLISTGEIKPLLNRVKNYIDNNLEVLKWFLEQTEQVDKEKAISFSNIKSGALQSINSFEPDPGNKCLINIDVLDFNKLYYKGYPTITGSNGVDVYATLLGIKENGQISVIKKAVASSFNPNEDKQATVEFELDVSDYKKLSIGWSNWGKASGKNPNLKLIKTSALVSKIDLVKNYIDNKIPKDTSVFSQKASLMLPEANYNINIIGDLPTDITSNRSATDVILDFKLGERTIISINTKMSIQGQASVNWLKKNFAIDFKNSFGDKLVVAFGNRVSTDGYVLKSQYADTSKIAEQVGCNIWHSIRTSGEFPENRIDNQAIDTALNAKEEIINEEGAKFFTYGFPVNIYQNGVFFGVYILRLKKGRNNYRFVNSNKKHIFLDFDYTLPGNSNSMLNFAEFKPGQWELRSPKLTGYEAGGQITDMAVMTPINNLWVWLSAIYNNSLSDVNSYAGVANLNAWIDYYLTCELLFHYDGLDNNILLGSWDGAHFSPLIYDCDGIFGMGPEILNISGRIINNSSVRGTQFWRRFGVYYSTQIKARYLFLKNSGTLSMSNFQKIVESQASKMTSEMIKDDNSSWGYLDVVKKSPQSILIFLKNRIAYLDTQFL